MKTLDEIEVMLSQIKNKETTNPMSDQYRQGMIEALEWVTGLLADLQQ